MAAQISGSSSVADTDRDHFVRWLDTLGSDDVGVVGGKNASLGEMISALQAEGVRVPTGFATTADAYREFLVKNGIEETINKHVEGRDDGEQSLNQAAAAIRQAFVKGSFPEPVEAAVRTAYQELCARTGTEDVDVAVRSSATAEDLPEASFAGQQDTFLNVRGADDLLAAVKKCFASLFTARAIAYREDKGFDHIEVALSVGVQRMVRSDGATAGVLFTIDPQTGFPGHIVIEANWGLGETVVQGDVNPDVYRVFKPVLDDGDFQPILERSLGTKEKKIVYGENGEQTVTVETEEEERGTFTLDDEEVLQLARWARAIEEHYDRPQDIEWAKDARSGDLYVVQSRPETVHATRDETGLSTYRLLEKGKTLVEGLAVGDAIAAGKSLVLKDASQADRFEEGSILVTGMTDPDWVPLMRQAAGIVTDRGGRTSHAAIVSRELGVPAIVGTGDATAKLADADEVTLSCAEGETGRVYAGSLDFERDDVSLEDVPETRTKIMMNIASPDGALRWWRLPTDGVGLARIEFIINNVIQAHPLALTRFDEVDDEDVRQRIEEITRGYEDKEEYFVDHLARGMAQIAAVHHPDPVIVRLSDFKTNEYADLVGGQQFEEDESNPMLGFRGASRYYSEHYRDAFALECRALKRARETLGLSNIIAMVPFCRTPEEGDAVLKAMAENGLVRGRKGFKVYVMAEVPSNIIQADRFAERFDGFSIGSNDLTQLILGVDRDSERLSDLFDERHEAVTRAIEDLIETAHEHGRPVGICGQAPSDHPEFADFLVEAGIDSISVNPDTVVSVRKRVAAMEA